jgi:hypothetical protein
MVLAFRMKILKNGNQKRTRAFYVRPHVGHCEKCGCLFEYEKENVQTFSEKLWDFNTYNKFIVCPEDNCRNKIVI